MSSLLKRIANSANSNRKYSLPWGDPTLLPNSSNKSTSASIANKSNNPAAAARLASNTDTRLSLDSPENAATDDADTVDRPREEANLINIDITVLPKIADSNKSKSDEFSIEVAADTAMFDLSIGLCGRLKLSPGDHTLVYHNKSATNQFGELSANQTVGTLTSHKLALVKKADLKSSNNVRKDKVIIKTKDQLENRIMVNLPKGQKMVIRLKPTTTIQEALDAICQEKGYPPDSYVIRHAKTGEILDWSKTLSQCETRELTFDKVTETDNGWKASSLMTTSCQSVLSSTRTSSIPVADHQRQRNSSAALSVPLNRKMFTDWNTTNISYHASSNSNLDYMPDVHNQPGWDEYSGSTLPTRGSNSDKRKGSKSSGSGKARRDKSVGDSAAQSFMSLFRRNKKKKDSSVDQTDPQVYRADDPPIASSLEEHVSRGGHSSTFTSSGGPPGHSPNDVITDSGIQRYNPLYMPDNSPSHQASCSHPSIISSSTRPVSMVVAPGSLSRGAAGAGGLVCINPPQAPGSVASLPRRKKKGAAPQPPLNQTNSEDIYDELNDMHFKDNSSTAMNSRASSQLWENSSTSVTPTCGQPPELPTSQSSLNRSLASLLERAEDHGAGQAASVDTGISSCAESEESPPIAGPYSTSSLQHPSSSSNKKKQAPPPPSLSKSSSNLATPSHDSSQESSTKSAVISSGTVPLALLNIPPPPGSPPPDNIDPIPPPNTRDQCVGVSSPELSPLCGDIPHDDPRTFSTISDEPVVHCAASTPILDGFSTFNVLDEKMRGTEVPFDHHHEAEKEIGGLVSSEYGDSSEQLSNEDCLQLMLSQFNTAEGQGDTSDRAGEEKEEVKEIFDLVSETGEGKDDTSEESVELTHWHTREHTVQRSFDYSREEMNELESSSGSTKSKASTVKEVPECDEELMFQMSTNDSAEPAYMMLNDCMPENDFDDSVPSFVEVPSDAHNETESPDLSEASSNQSGDFVKEVLASCPKQIIVNSEESQMMTQSWCPSASSTEFSTKKTDKTTLRKTVHEDNFPQNRLSEFMMESSNSSPINNNDVDFILERKHIGKCIFDSRLIKKQSSGVPPPVKVKPVLPKRISSITNSNKGSTGQLFFAARSSTAGCDPSNLLEEDDHSIAANSPRHSINSEQQLEEKEDHSSSSDSDILAAVQNVASLQL